MATDMSTTSSESSSTGESSTGSTENSGMQTGKLGKGFHHHDGDHAPITAGSLNGDQSGTAHGMHFMPPSFPPMTPSESSTTSTTSSSSSSTSTDTTPPSWMSDAGHTHHDWTVPSSMGTSTTSGHDVPFGGNGMDYHTANTGSVIPTTQN